MSTMKLLSTLLSLLSLSALVSARTEGSLELIAVKQAGSLEARFAEECAKPENADSCTEVTWEPRFPQGLTVADINDAWSLMPQQQQQMFVVYTDRFVKNSEAEGHVIIAPEDLDNLNALSNNFGTDRKTYVIMHGWLQSVAEIDKYADAILAVEDAQIIGVDWAQMATGADFFLSVHNVYRVAEYVGRMVTYLVQQGQVDVDNLNVVGHSMGCVGASQIASVIRRETGQMVRRATGLDCARPYFELFPDSRKMNKEVARVVEVVHTNAGTVLENQASGEFELQGHVDFFVDGGTLQSKCLAIPCDFSNPDCWMMINGCSHVAALDYYLESFGRCAAFVGHRSGSQQEFEEGVCDGAVAAIGADLDEDNFEDGVYYLEANPNKPYAQGLVECYAH